MSYRVLLAKAFMAGGALVLHITKLSSWGLIGAFGASVLVCLGVVGFFWNNLGLPQESKERALIALAVVVLLVSCPLGAGRHFFLMAVIGVWGIPMLSAGTSLLLCRKGFPDDLFGFERFGLASWLVLPLLLFVPAYGIAAVVGIACLFITGGS